MLRLSNQRERTQSMPQNRARRTRPIIGICASFSSRDGSNIITVGPPICVTRDDCDEIVAGIDASLTEVEAEMGVN